MARPRIDAADRVTYARLAPPSSLTAAERKRWDSELSRFPPAYFTPADTSALVHYLRLLEEFERIHAAHKRARGDAKNATAKELRAVSKSLTVLQRALRMFPTCRASRTLAGNLAADPTAQAPPADSGEEPWERMMREAGANVSRNAN